MENPFAPSKRLFGNSKGRTCHEADVPPGSRGLGSGMRDVTGGTPWEQGPGILGGQRRADGCGSSRGEDVGTACAIPEPSSSQSHAEPKERSITRH